MTTKRPRGRPKGVTKERIHLSMSPDAVAKLKTKRPSPSKWVEAKLEES